MTQPFTTFSIEVTGASSHNCYHETTHKLKQLNAPFTKAHIIGLDDMGMLGSGQELRYDLESQEKVPADEYNAYWILSVVRLCDSGD